MKRKITLSKDELIGLVGKIKANELLNPKTNIKLSKKEVKHIEKALIAHGIATVRVTKLGGNVEIVSKKFVTIAPRFRFEKTQYHNGKHSKKAAKTAMDSLNQALAS